MISNLLTAQALLPQGGSAMPAVRVRVESVSTLATGADKTAVDGSAAWTYPHADVPVTGAFSGPPAWSPPI